MQLQRFSFTRAAALLMALALALMPSPPLAAQDRDPPPQDGDQIVVMGVRDREEAIENYVEGLTDIVPDQPLARYVDGEYCPGVIGLSPQRNGEIAARMRRVAAAAGVKPAREGCLTSALVIFVDSTKSFIPAFRARHPTYFNDLQRQRRIVPEGRGPAVAWHLVQLLDPQGNPLSHTEEGYNIVVSPTGGSRIRPMVRPVVAMSVVIVEREALVGLTATQVADYVLMRTLTDAEPDDLGVPPGVTILGALRAPMGSSVPASLTEWDLAYIKGRYSVHPVRFGSSQGAAIRNSMRRALTEGEAK